MYIIIHRQTVSLYYTSSVWLDIQDVSCWKRKPADFFLCQSDILLLSESGGILRYTFKVHNSWEELCIYPYVAPRKFSTRKEYIYIYIYMGGNKSVTTNRDFSLMISNFWLFSASFDTRSSPKEQFLMEKKVFSQIFKKMLLKELIFYKKKNNEKFTGDVVYLFVEGK